MSRTFWLGSLLYLIGLVLAGGLLAFSTWAAFEGSLFEGGLPAEERLSTLRCPLLITNRGEDQISARFANQTNRSVRRRMDVFISDGFVSRSRYIPEDIVVEPGTVQRLVWSISSRDVVWDRFIFARVYVNRSFPLPSLTGTCGILYLDSALMTGGQLSTFLLLLIMSSLGGGGFLWWRGDGLRRRRSREITRALGALGLGLLLGLVATLLGWWIVAAALLIVSVLLVVVLVVWVLEEGG